MARRSAPKFCFLLLWFAIYIPAQTGGQDGRGGKVLEDPLSSVESIKSGNRVKRSLSGEDDDSLNSAQENDELLKLFSRKASARDAQRRDVQNTDSERDNIPGDLYPETAMHNLEQTSDKIKSDMFEKKSEIPKGTVERVSDTRDKAVYNIGQDVSLEIPLTTNIDQPRVEELTKRDIVPHQGESKLKSEVKDGSSSESSQDKVGHKVRNANRRDEVPLSGRNFFHNSLDDASDEDFRVRDKSADLEIHADSSGVRVKAKPASLQVVSNPHGDVKTLPGETHSEGMVAERRTFTPVLPAEKRSHHHLHGLGPRPLTHLPFLRHHHRFHRLHHHRLPWLRHRQHINYPDIFERMRFNSLPEAPSPFGSPFGAPLSVAPPMASMMNSPPPMMSGISPSMSLMGSGGMGAPFIPQLLQRAPTMEANPANRFGVPESPRGEMSPMEDTSSRGMSPMSRMSPFTDMSPMVRMGPMGDMTAMGAMNPPLGDMSPISKMNAMGDMPLMDRMGPMGGMSPMGRMGQMDSMMGSMSPSAPFGQSEMRRKNALEFWGLPNRDQIRALVRGENVQKVLGSNRYGESLGGITPSMNFPGGMNPGMGGPSFNANGMGDSGMMGPFGGTSSAMFHGMPGRMNTGMRRNMLYKKDDINKTDAYKKSMKLKKSKAVSDTTKSGHEKFEDGILKKAKSLVAGQKHIAKNEETELHREHRIRKSSKLAHDEEKRSLDKTHAKKTTTKHQKTKNVKGSKKDVAVQRPPIIYHPPPEVFHRPDIVLHRPPVLFHRPPIVYHQAPVVVHRPAVVYRQSPIIFHQPHPMVSQPYYRAWDNFQMNPAYSHVGTHSAMAYNYVGIPPEMTGYKKGEVPSKPNKAGKKAEESGEKESKRAGIPHPKDAKKSNVEKKDKVDQKKKKDVVVNRPPIIYHPPPEVYHRPEIVVHRAPLLIRRPPIIYHQPAVIVHRPPVVYHQPPLIFHQPAPTVNQPVLYSHDNFVVHPSFFATHHGSIVSDAGQLLGMPNTVSVPDTGGFPFEPTPGLAPGMGMLGGGMGMPGGGMGMPGGGMGMPPIAPMGRRKRSLHHKKKRKHENARRKNMVMVKRPPIVYHPPPEVYHRPDIVVHRAPVVIHRSPIIYHQSPVVVHRPAVVYHQPPVMFHQPVPMVTQPTFTSHDLYTPHHKLTFTGSTAPSPVYSSVALVSTSPSQKSSIRKHKKSNPEDVSDSENVSKKSGVKSHSENEKVKSHQSKNRGQKRLTKKASINDHIQKMFTEDDAKKLAAFFSLRSLETVSAAQVLSIINDRKPDKDDIEPIVKDNKLKAITVEQLGAIENFLNKNEVEAKKLSDFLKEPSVVELSVKQLGKKLDDFVKRLRRSHENEVGSKKGEILRGREEKASKKNAVLVKRPPIIYHPPPEVYHRPDIVVHRAPLVIHRSPIIYHQAPVVVHRPAVVYHQPPVLFHQPPPVVNQPVLTSHDVYHETPTLTHSSSSVVSHGAYFGLPGEIMEQHPYGKSKVPRRKHNKKTRRAIVKENDDETKQSTNGDAVEKGEKASKKDAITNKDGTEKASKKNAVLVKRPPIIYHPPPEVYHRPDIVVHRAPIVIHRAPLVYHQAPVIVHRPAVVYHQPAVIFHQPPPMVHQPMFTSHDSFTTHNTLSLGGSTTQKVGDFEGPPPEMFATRKGDVPKDVKGTSRDSIPKSKVTKGNPQHPQERTVKEEESKHGGKDKHSHRRSHLRKLILSLQKDHTHEKKGLQVAAGTPLVLQRPPLILSRPAVMAPAFGHSIVAPISQPLIQRVVQPVPVYQPVLRQVPVPVIRPVPVPVVYHHHHWPVHFHHHHIQPVAAPLPHYTSFSYHPYSYGKSDVPHHKKDTIHIHDYGVPAHGHVAHVNGNSHVVTHHGYATRHADCPSHCGTCKPPNCPSDCKPHCIAIIHHQHHRPHHVFVNHQHHHNIAQTHFHNHHWPVHHHDVYHNHPYLPNRHIGYPVHTYPPYHHHGRRNADDDQRQTVPHYKVYQHVKHWHPPCIHHSKTCHHHHHPMTVYHGHQHPTKVLHHHHYRPYPVYHHHEHIKPVIYHHVKPYPIHHHHAHQIHDTWHHDTHHHTVSPPVPYPIPVTIPTPIEVPVPVTSTIPMPMFPQGPNSGPVPVMLPWTPNYGSAHHSIMGRSNVPHHEQEKEARKTETSELHRKTKKSETSKPEKETKKSQTRKKKKDVVVNRPPIIYHPPPEVYHRPEIVVHRAPVLIHRPPIVYHQPAVIVHRPPVVYHQSPVVFHQPAPTVNQPVLYSHDNFVVHPSMFASHAGTMVESAGHFLGLPSGPITNYPGPLPGFGGPQGFGMAPYATPFGRKRRSAKGNESPQKKEDNSPKQDNNSEKGKESSEKDSNSKKANRKNAIVVHRPPVIYHPPPEIYHRPRVVVHRPDVLIHRPPIVVHQSPVVLHRPPVVYHQTPLIFHQPPPMINQPVYHSHDAYMPHPVFNHYDSQVHHMGSYQGIPPYSYGYHGFGGGYHGFGGGYHGSAGGFLGMHGGFGGYPGLHGGIGDFHGGFGGFHGPFAPGFGRSKIEKPKQKKKIKTDKDSKKVKKHKKEKTHKKSTTKSEQAKRKHSVMVHRPPVIFHPPPEVYHRPAYVIHQPDIVIHRPSTVYHQSPVVVHHPPIAYHQPPVVVHQPPPVMVQPTYHHHQFFHECGGHGCYGGGPHLYGRFGGYGGCFGRCGGFGGFGGFGHGCCGGFGGGFHGGNPFLYGKSSVPKHSRSKEHTTEHKHGNLDSDESTKHHKNEHKTSSDKSKAPKSHHEVKEKKGSKKNNIVIHRPPLVYHPPPEIYHRPDIILHRPDVLVHRPSIVYDQPSVVLHRPAVIYHEPDVVFHQPPPLVNLPIYHASDMYAPHPVYTEAGSEVGFDHNVQGVPPHFSYGAFGVSHAFGKSKIERSKVKQGAQSDGDDSGDKKNGRKSEKGNDKESEDDVAEEKTADDTKTKDNSAKLSKTKGTDKEKHQSSHHSKQKTKTTKAHKKYHLIMHRPPMIYHSSPTIYHRPDVVVHHPDIVIHRPSVVIQPPSVVVHKPAVVYHQPPVVFHQPEPAINQPVYHSEDAYAAHPVYSHVGSDFEYGGSYLAHPGLGHGYGAGYHDGFSGFGFHGHGDGHAFPGFGKSKIQKAKDAKTEEKDEGADTKEDEPEKHKHDETKHDKSKDEKEHEHAKRDTHATNTKRVQLPRAQKEKTETGTKKNAIVVRRPPIIYHPPPEVYHRPDIVVHRAPIVIQRAPLVYHQSPVIVHRPAVVYHQPAVVFHQPAPAVHQPVFHSVDTFSVHPHLSFSQAGSNVHQVGEYVGVPQEVMHRSTVPTSTVNHKDTANAPTDLPHPKERRATMEQHVTPITPLNYIQPRHPLFETLRSSIPYPTLHPHSLSYSSFPWGFPPRSKRSVAPHPYLHPELSTMVPHDLYPLPYSPFYHPSPLQRPHVNVNIETVKSNVPKAGSRKRRQSMLDPSLQLPNPAPIQTEAIHYGHLGSYPVLPRPHVNVNVETIKSSVPRSRRQVLAGLPTTQTAAFAPQTYSQSVVPVAPASLPNPPEEQLGVYRDLLGAIYPRGVHRRPKVNIVVQTAKSTIPTVQNVKKSVLPGPLRKENVDAFNTMPEVTTIEPPLLRDGVRVNMVDLGDPTTDASPSSSSNLAPNLQPSYSNMNMQNFGMSAMGLGAQGNYGMDKWKKFTVPRPSRLWHDVNADKKSAVPSVHREAPGKKRFTINELQSGIQNPGQSPEYQSGFEPYGSIPPTAGYSPPSGYATGPQVLGPQTDGVENQGQPESANLINQNSGIPQTGRPNVNVNVETYKKHTLGSTSLPNKRQIIGTLPLTSLFRPNPDTTKASLKTLIPSTNIQHRNNPQLMEKRQQIIRRVPLAQAIPTVRHRVENARASPESSTRGYAAFPVQDTQAPAPRTFPYQALQTATHPQLTTPRPGAYVQPTVTEAPLPPTQPSSSYLSTLYPWGTRRHVNINIETAKSKIPSMSNGPSSKIITPRFKREFPVLYNIIKAKAELDAAKKDGKGRRNKRQIPMFSGGFLQSLIPDANLLAKRAFYGSVPRYPINPALLFPRASRPRPEKQSMGTIEVGGRSAGSPLSGAARLLKNEFSQSFDDIAKIQRQEVNAIKGMNMGGQAPSPSVMNIPEQTSPGAEVVSDPEQGATPGMLSAAPGNAEASAVPMQAQAQQQPEVLPASPQQTMATFAAAPQVLPAAGQQLPAQFTQQAPMEIAPGFVRGKPQPAIQGQTIQGQTIQAPQAPEPAMQATEPAIQAAGSAVSKKSPFMVVNPEQLPSGFQPQFPIPGLQFPMLAPAELPPQAGLPPQPEYLPQPELISQPVSLPPAEIPAAVPYPRPFLNPIPQPQDDSDRPSINIQVQTSKSKIPKLKAKKVKDAKNKKKKTH